MEPPHLSTTTVPPMWVLAVGPGVHSLQLQNPSAQARASIGIIRDLSAPVLSQTRTVSTVGLNYDIAGTHGSLSACEVPPHPGLLSSSNGFQNEAGPAYITVTGGPVLLTLSVPEGSLLYGES